MILLGKKTLVDAVGLPFACGTVVAAVDEEWRAMVQPNLLLLMVELDLGRLLRAS